MNLRNIVQASLLGLVPSFFLSVLLNILYCINMDEPIIIQWGFVILLTIIFDASFILRERRDQKASRSEQKSGPSSGTR
jgi:hypothetical protein